MTAVRTRGRSATATVAAESTTLRVHPRRRVSARLLMVVSAVLFFAVVGGAVAIQAQRVEAQHRIDELSASIRREAEINRVLRADVAVAESPDRIVDAARALQLVAPGPVVPLVPGAGIDQADEADSETVEEAVD